MKHEDGDKTELDRCTAGETYHYDAPEIAARKNRASAGCAMLNACDPLDAVARDAAARELFGPCGAELDVQPGFQCDVGTNITCGNRCTFNFGVSILDGAPVTFGNNCMVGPGCVISTTGHPLSAAGRRQREAFSKPIVFGDDVWLGANVCVMPGVRIGNNVVVGAGAVVTHDIPSNSLAMGVPARIVRTLEE